MISDIQAATAPRHLDTDELAAGLREFASRQKMPDSANDRGPTLVRTAMRSGASGIEPATRANRRSLANNVVAEAPDDSPIRRANHANECSLAFNS